MIVTEDKLRFNLSLNDIVNGSGSGTIITIEDLATRCRSITELLDTVHLAAQKTVWIRSEKQPWFDMNAQKENPMITLMRLAALQNKMCQNFPCSHKAYELTEQPLR